MKAELEPTVPPAIASLLERARQRFRVPPTQNPSEEARTLRDLLAQEGRDANGRPLESPDGPISPAVRLGNRSEPRRIAELAPASNPEAPFNMEFGYRGRNGQLTQRRVSVCLSDAEYFAGHCHLRNGHRLFSWDSVEGQVRLPDTGELADVDVIRGRFA